LDPSPQLQLQLGEAPIRLDTILVRSAAATPAGGMQHTLEFLPGQLPQRAALARQLFRQLSAPESNAVGQLIPPARTIGDTGSTVLQPAHAG
jgi:hypothetical protein